MLLDMLYANSDWHRGQYSRSCGNIAQVPKARGQYSCNWGK